jgi:hypothetical protein
MKFLITAVVSYLTQLIESSDSDPRSNGFYTHFLFYKIEILRRSFVLHTTTNLKGHKCFSTRHVFKPNRKWRTDDIRRVRREVNCRFSALRKFPQIDVSVPHSNDSTNPTDITWWTVPYPSHVFTLQNTKTISHMLDITRYFNMWYLMFVSIIHLFYTRWRQVTARQNIDPY